MPDLHLADDAEVATGLGHRRRQHSGEWLPAPGIRIEWKRGVPVKAELHKRRQLVPRDMKRVKVRPVLYRNLVKVCLRIGRPDLAEDR
jgi:hypothetical protein